MEPVDLNQRERQALLRREQILEVALALFAREGFHGVSTRKIAQTAGITEGLIFHYFPTKEDLLAGVLETRHSFLQELKEHVQQDADQPVDILIPQLAMQWLETLHREQAITLVLFGEAQTNPKINAMLGGLIQEGVGRIAGYVRKRQALGEVRADAPIEAGVQMFFSSLMLFFLIQRELPESEWQARSRQYVRDAFQVWWNGMQV